MNPLSLQSSRAVGATSSDSLVIFLDLDQSAFGPTAAPVASAVRQSCSLVLPDDPFPATSVENFYDLATEKYAELRQGADGERNAATYLAYVSTFFHEIRHVHDLLSTIYGQEVFFTMFNCAQNAPALLAELHEWVANGNDRVILAPLGRNLARLEGLDTEITKVIVHYGKALSDIDDFGRAHPSSPSSITLTHLLEASAVDIQLNFIHDTFGREALFDLIAFIHEGGASDAYLQIRDEMTDIFSTRELTGSLGPVLNYVNWISLMPTTFPGRPFAEGPTSVAFYEAIVQQLGLGASEVTLESAKAMTAEFCAAWGLLKPSEAISNRRAYFEGMTVRINEGWRRQGVPDPFNLAATYSGFVKTHRALCDWILASEDSYFDANKYVPHVIMGHLPAVSLKLKCDGKLHDFMTPGYLTVPFDNWNNFSIMATVFRLLVNGRATGETNSWEDLCWNKMLEGAWGTRLPIREQSALFD
jgi:hypothetical protein